jgi:phenylacetate-CoA ligase
MKLLNRQIFILAHQTYDFDFLSTYKGLMKHQCCSKKELEQDQLIKLKNMINFAYENVPYYRRTFKAIDLTPDKILNLQDMEKIPVLTKEIIRDNYEDLKPININKYKYLLRNTGGSTGTPMEYRIDKKERLLMAAIMYRGWSYAGYGLGDKTLFFGGSSLGTSQKTNLLKTINEKVRNIRMVSSFDMEDSNLDHYIKIINKFKPKYIYGYASSINFFASYINKNNNLIYKPTAIFSTSEKLFQSARRNIENAFDTHVFDTYGLNDGGVTAFECSEHTGLHIDTERSLMEVVDDDHHQLNDGVGMILATSLGNYSMPFIRYETGDIANIADQVCGCGRNYHKLREITGRSVDILITPEGKTIHGWFFLYIFWEYGKKIEEYQVVQKTKEKIIIKIVPKDGFDEKQLDQIREIVNKRSPGWDIEFQFVDSIERTGAGKYKFILNEVINE